MAILKPLAAAGLASLIALASPAQAQGDLTRKPIALPDLVMGNEQSDYALSQKEYQLETGKAYKLAIISSGLKEYALQAPEFFAAIYLRKVEAGGMEIKAVSLTELEFEDAAEAEIYFVPVKPGRFEFAMDGLEHKGMTGVFNVR
ncbi:copper-binding protein [Marinobacterium arenosum]|uniref:copper-binding protein n=1 Tax=Marinobacterium arenosum TaxID=2862496 RepID=UPI001C97A8E5|nr:copper-binding protein [Marinobacterium arenosum]MBY4675857.1 copper-binding protein [Marinobacterium arenosum]